MVRHYSALGPLRPRPTKLRIGHKVPKYHNAISLLIAHLLRAETPSRFATVAVAVGACACAALLIYQSSTLLRLWMLSYGASMDAVDALTVPLPRDVSICGLDNIA